MTRKVSPGLVEALRLAGLPRRKPTDADRPPPSVIPGRKPPRIAGQLELADVEHQGEEAVDDAA